MILVNKDGTKVDVHPTKVEYLLSKGWKEEAAYTKKKKEPSSKQITIEEIEE